MDENETLGKFLKDQRESKNISIKEMVKKTRISSHSLHALEEDRYDLLPSPTYIKGFLVLYAKNLELDPKEILLRYKNSIKQESKAPSILQPQQAFKQVDRGKTKKTIWTWGIFVTIFILFCLLYLLPSQPPAPPVVEKPAPGGPAPAKPAFTKMPAPSLPAPVTPPSPVKKAVSLQLKAVERVWASFKLDDQPEKEITIQPGESISLQASNQISILLGNAGGLELTLNGKNLGKYGSSGEVANLIVTPQGVEKKKIETVQAPQTP